MFVWSIASAQLTCAWYLRHRKGLGANFQSALIFVSYQYSWSKFRLCFLGLHFRPNVNLRGVVNRGKVGGRGELNPWNTIWHRLGLIPQTALTHDVINGYVLLSAVILYPLHNSVLSKNISWRNHISTAKETRETLKILAPVCPSHNGPFDSVS